MVNQPFLYLTVLKGMLLIGLSSGRVYLFRHRHSRLSYSPAKCSDSSTSSSVQLTLGVLKSFPTGVSGCCAAIAKRPAPCACGFCWKALKLRSRCQ